MTTTIFARGACRGILLAGLVTAGTGCAVEAADSGAEATEDAVHACLPASVRAAAPCDETRPTFLAWARDRVCLEGADPAAVSATLRAAAIAVGARATGMTRTAQIVAVLRAADPPAANPAPAACVADATEALYERASDRGDLTDDEAALSLAWAEEAIAVRCARKGEADLRAISAVLQELGRAVDHGLQGKALALALVHMLETLD